MYHEEQVIDGVLHHRGTPDGQWLVYTVEQLTVKYEKLNVELSKKQQELEK